MSPPEATQRREANRTARGTARMRLRGLLRKESLQVIRDPSSVVLALIMPVALLFLFGYGVSLDAENVPVAVVLDHPGPNGYGLAETMGGSRYLEPSVFTSTGEAERALRSGEVEGILRVPDDFERGFRTEGEAALQLIVNGTDSNRARQIIGYVSASLSSWLSKERQGKASSGAGVQLQSRMWFNETSRSENFLVPGLIVLIMTLTGALLTALVMAREWERGTMEALLVTPVRIGEIMIGKLLPYFALGMGGMLLAVVMAVYLFEVPLRGSMITLVTVSALFMLAALGMGLFISVAAKNQFIAGQTAILATFLPAFFLSGFIFDLHNSPAFIRVISYAVAARYFATVIKTVFLAGDVWSIIVPNALALVAMAVFFLGLARKKTHKRLE